MAPCCLFQPHEGQPSDSVASVQLFIHGLQPAVFRTSRAHIRLRPLPQIRCTVYGGCVQGRETFCLGIVVCRMDVFVYGLSWGWGGGGGGGGQRGGIIVFRDFGHLWLYDLTDAGSIRDPSGWRRAVV